jgi:hypothetical protein
VPFNAWEDPEDWAAMGVLMPELDGIPSGIRAYGGLQYWFAFSAGQFGLYRWSEVEPLMSRLVLRFTAMEWKVTPAQLRNTEPSDFAPMLRSPIGAIRETAMFAVTLDRESLGEQ